MTSARSAPAISVKREVSASFVCEARSATAWALARRVPMTVRASERVFRAASRLIAAFWIEVVSPALGKVRAWNVSKWGMKFTVERPLVQASAEDYDALLLPGGEESVRALRRDERAMSFIPARDVVP